MDWLGYWRCSCHGHCCCKWTYTHHSTTTPCSADTFHQAVFTWFVVAYQVVTEKLAPARAFYHIIAVLALDLYMIIIWLCAWALNAARASTLPDLDNRFGSFDGDDFCFLGTCFKTKRSIAPRAVKYRSLKGLLGGAAGIGALVW